METQVIDLQARKDIKSRVELISKLVEVWDDTAQFRAHYEDCVSPEGDCNCGFDVLCHPVAMDKARQLIKRSGK